jgi:hypothetical protein
MTGELSINFNSHNRKGKNNKTVHIYSNDAKESIKKITITANVLPPGNEKSS